MSGKDVNQAMQDLVVDAMRRSQEAMVDLVRSWRAQWEGNSFSMPEGFPGMPTVPPMITPEQIDAAFDFAERMLADQRRFAKELLRASMPALGGGGSGGPRRVSGGSTPS